MQNNVVTVLALVDQYRIGARLKNAKQNIVLPGGNSYGSTVTTASVLNNYICSYQGDVSDVHNVCGPVNVSTVPNLDAGSAFYNGEKQQVPSADR